MENNQKSSPMEIQPNFYDHSPYYSLDKVGSWPKLESPKGLRNYSFSVLYQTLDFPFPSIHCHSHSEDLLDSQFSVGCTHGGGSLLSSLDVSLDSCLGEVKCLPRTDVPLMLYPKEEHSVMAPRITNSGDDIRDSNSQGAPAESMASNRLSRPQSITTVATPTHTTEKCEEPKNRIPSVQTLLQHPHVVGTKEPNPVEFRSGYRGVSWNRRMKAWLAFWSEGKNRRSKTFNAKVMGFDKARAAAIDFLKKKKQFLQQLDPSYNDYYDDEDYNEGGSLADSATTTSDTPSGSVMDFCSVCGTTLTSGVGSADGLAPVSFLSSECSLCCGSSSNSSAMHQTVGIDDGVSF